MGVIQKSSEISDLIIGAYQMDDESRPEGAIGKLDMDDEVADIIDDKIEKAFIQFLIQEISDTKNLEQDIDANWNITNALKAFLAREKNNRTITGFEKG
jgi:hypothetical protein